LESALIVAIKGSREVGLVASRVELPVSVSNREEHAREVGECHGDLRDVAGNLGILFQEKSANEGARDDGEELVGARVQVRHVETAGADESDGGGNVGADETRDGVDRANNDRPVWIGGVIDELERDIVGRARAVGEENLLFVLVGGCKEELGLKRLDLGRRKGGEGRGTAAARGSRGAGGVHGRCDCRGSKESQECPREEGVHDHGCEIVEGTC
jgi:hypothetical protein